MKAWPAPSVPRLPGAGELPLLHDTSSGELVTAGSPDRDDAGLYVCGITPYDATHMGHAATYVAFDTLRRVWLDAGRTVRFVQNVTDIDDPLLERACERGIDWQDLAEDQSDLYHDDMTALRVLPPDHYISVTESVDLVERAVERLLETGYAYRVPTADSLDQDDIYQDLSAGGGFGDVSGWNREQMLEVFAERGGDPEREGKRGEFDPLLWRGARAGEPAWDNPILGRGRPGWHIECACIACANLEMPFDVQAGGSDLIFPHHEMSAVHAAALGYETFARAYAHAGMVALHGEKMSKSKGNLVFVHALLRDGADPMAIRVALLGQHYRSDWEWTDALWRDAVDRLQRWREGLALPAARSAQEALLEQVRSALHRDLDSPAAVAAVDRYVEAVTAAAGHDGNAATAQAYRADTSAGRADGAPDRADAVVAPQLARELLDALLGISL